MLINIYLGNMGWKWTGDELQASEYFLTTSNILVKGVKHISTIVLVNI